MTRAIIVLVGAALLAGCRDDVPPFQPVTRTNSPPSWALTYGAGNDTDPRWSAAGDSVMYHTNLLGVVPGAGATIAAIPYEGGVASPVLTSIPTFGRRYVTPAYSAAGDNVAYVDLIGVDAICPVPPPPVCPQLPCPPPVPECIKQPLLDSAVLRVRRIDEVRNIELDPRITIRFAGTSPVYRFAQADTWAERYFPFQERHRTASEYVFRPTWSPDGQRIAFSDGLAIHLWDVDSDTTSIVPGTVDAVSAAWSPMGEWIAFTLLARTDSITENCGCVPERIAVRTGYITADPVVVIVRPDGSERIELGAGDDPAWSPDGTAVYARRDSMIVRIPLGGGATVEIAGTAHGRAPAVSPDGRWLAFSRAKPSSPQDHDIWVTSLDP